MSSISSISIGFAIILGCNLVLFVCLFAYGKLTSVVFPKHSKISEPLSFTPDSVYNLTKDVSKLGILLLATYLCENHPPNPHAQKSHDMDMFWCLTAVLFVYSFTDIRKCKTSEILNREQTEEWKGWMQFMFLLYHYYSAHEAYNSIRVMITCYVWMTGFGNFSFFYIKQDFGALRLIQMLWRLNFLVLCLCLTLGNSYILYYICPLHTFYFLIVFVSMLVMKNLNHSRWGIRIKLLVLAVVIYCIWDLRLGLFNTIFGIFLSTEPVIGATSGSLYEWYFRTSLDHWSTFLGMIFALNFPMSSAWLKATESLPPKQQLLTKGIPSMVALGLLGWWAWTVLPLPKLSYNNGNAYLGCVPMLCYIFLRNVNPTLREWYLHPLHNIGKVTLETYLMQHHVWLTSNAKTILNIVPGYPKVNLLVGAIFYIFVSKEMHNLTMSLRGMLLPEGPLLKSLWNLAGMGAALLVSWILVVVLQAMGIMGLFSFFVIISTAGCGLFALFLLQIPPDNNWIHEQRPVDVSPLVKNQVKWSMSSAVVACAVFTLGVSLYTQTMPSLLGLNLYTSSASKSFSATAKCSEIVNNGHWISSQCGVKEKNVATCQSLSWVWSDIPDNCHVKHFETLEVQEILKGKKVMVIGDSVGRQTYYSLIKLQGDKEAAADAHNPNIERHSNLKWKSSLNGVTEMEFIWAPFAADLEKQLQNIGSSPPDILLMNNGLWDCLNNPSKLDSDYIPTMTRIKEILSEVQSVKMWSVPTTIVDHRLLTKEKREQMTEKQVQVYRAAVENLNLASALTGKIDGQKLTAGRASDCFDGVHYSDDIYDLIAQVFMNLVTDFNQNAPPPLKPPVIAQKPVGLMANPSMGMGMLAFIFICIVFMDSYAGVPSLTLKSLGLSGDHLSWDNTYGQLHAKIGISDHQRPRAETFGKLKADTGDVQT